MAHAAKARFSAEGQDGKTKVIQATDEWFNALNELPFKSSKLILIWWLIGIWWLGENGKTLHLLKQCSKKI